MRSNYQLLKICLIFFGCVLGFNLIEWFLLKPEHMTVIESTTAKVTALVIGLSGLSVHLQGTQIFFHNAHWEVVTECTALNAFYVYISFLLAYPSSIKAKAIGTLVGLPFLFVANILRLFVLAWALQIFPAYADLMHDYIWQVMFMFLLILMWLCWIDLVVKNEKLSDLHS